MSKTFLIVRIVLLLALLFLLAAVFWGLANRESTAASGGAGHSEPYEASKPAGYTPYLLVGLVVLGIFITVASIFFEYHQYRKGMTKRGPGGEAGGVERETWS